MDENTKKTIILVVEVVGFVAACLGIFAFVTGWQSIFQIINGTQPIIQVQPSPTPDCSLTTELGPWPTMGDVFMNARDGWVQADFWSPARTLKKGYDEVAVIFEPGLEVTVTGVAGNGWNYGRGWTKEDIERCTLKHIEDSLNIRHKRLILITVTELCAITVCR